jgi:hypothetical protein
MAVPDSSPRAFAVVSVRNPQRLVLPDGTFFPPCCCAIPWGRASAPASVAPKPWRSVHTPARFFHSVVPACEVSVSVGFGDISASLGGAMRIYWHLPASRRFSPASSPRAWAHSRLSGLALRLVHVPLHHPSAGRRDEVSTTPIVRVTNRGSLVELLTGGSSGRPCPVR